jgi:hypothetical protein
VLSAALSSDANAMARLRREASLGMRLAHPNVCHIIRSARRRTGSCTSSCRMSRARLSDRTTGSAPSDRRSRVPCARHRRGARRARELKIVHRDLGRRM